MSSVIRRLREQGGQAMLEYTLIAVTVVVGFAAASALGLGNFWTNNLDEARNKDYLVLSCQNFNNCVDTIGSLNSRIEYR